MILWLNLKTNFVVYMDSQLIQDMSPCSFWVGPLDLYWTPVESELIYMFYEVPKLENHFIKKNLENNGKKIVPASAPAEPKIAPLPLSALFTSKKFCKIGIVALSFVFDKYCSIMN